VRGKGAPERDKGLVPARGLCSCFSLGGVSGLVLKYGVG